MKPLEGLRVLVVEDETLIAMDLEALLAECGCVVLGPVKAVDEALALVERELPEFAVLDIDLGRETVFPVADALCARAVPFVFLSVHNHHSVHNRHVIPPGHAARPRVSKPFRASQLHGTLVTTLVSSKAQSSSQPVLRGVPR